MVNTIAAFLFGYANGDNQARMFRYAGLVIIGSGFFDLVDGRVARASNQVTRFGGFFDSVIDRYSDASQFFGLLVFYSRGDRFFYVVLTAFVMVSAIMVSYTRARAESLIGSCRVGFMERPERLVLVIIGALFNRMAPVLWLIAVLSTITVIHRIRYTWTRTEGVDAVPHKAGQAAKWNDCVARVFDSSGPSAPGKVLTSEFNPRVSLKFKEDWRDAAELRSAWTVVTRRYTVLAAAFSCYPDFLFLFEDSSWLILFL